MAKAKAPYMHNRTVQAFTKAISRHREGWADPKADMEAASAAAIGPEGRGGAQ